MLNQTKCQFMAVTVEFLGYKINSHRLNPLAEKVRAHKQAPKPINITESKVYLHLIVLQPFPC